MNNTVRLMGKDLTSILISTKKSSKNYYVDKHTGEVVLVETIKKLPEHKVYKYVGIDCKWLKDCVTEDDYKTTIGVIDGWALQSVRIDHRNLSLMMIDGEITIQQAKLLTEISKRIVGWNIALISTKELAQSSGINGKNVARAMKAMEPSTIRIVKRDCPNRGDITVEVNPMVAWKGGMMFRDSKLKSWTIGRYYSLGITDDT